MTTNAPTTSPAFQRRMDAVIDFRPPEHDERYALWALHLPPDHAVDDGYLRVASRALRPHGGPDPATSPSTRSCWR